MTQAEFVAHVERVVSRWYGRSRGEKALRSPEEEATYRVVRVRPSGVREEKSVCLDYRAAVARQRHWQTMRPEYAGEFVIEEE